MDVRFVVCIARDHRPAYPGRQNRRTAATDSDRARPPQVTNVVAVQRSGTKLVDVTYNLYDADGDPMTVALYISPDGGVSFPIQGLTVTGDVGAGILSGTGRHIEWDAGADYPGHEGETYVPRVTADDGEAPAGMIWIPAGHVRLGQVGVPYAEPVNDFYVGSFYIDRYEVSNAKYKAFDDAGGYTTAAYWNPVGWAWRLATRIELPGSWEMNDLHGGGIAGNEQFPVTGVSWWEADAYCRWAGVRLPTEAEWEKAAKGGCETHGDPGQCDAADTPTYPWGEGITGPQANYSGSGDPYEGNGETTPVGYYDGTSHGGYQTIDSPSPYGLYDVAGNASEWCSTKNASYPYNPNDGQENPPVSSDECCRVWRGGSFGSSDSDDPRSGQLRCATRNAATPDYRFPYARDAYIGFRSAGAGAWGAGPLFHLDTLARGACCAIDGTCTVTPQAACAAPNTWTLAGVCDPDPCPKPGSCCALDHTCTVTLQAACAAPNTWTLAGVCDPDPCPKPGSCCAFDHTCTVTLQADCAAPSTWTLAGVCDPDPCSSSPEVTNVVAVQRPGTRLVDVTYDLYDADGDAMTVELYISPDGGESFPIHCLAVSGDVGPGVTSGTGRHIEWDAGADFPEHVGETYAPKVVANDGQGMVWIPAGNVRLGQTGIAEPVNDFYVEGFYIDRYEVSNAKYKAFIDAGGYTAEAYWNPVGWAWMVANGVFLQGFWNETLFHGGGIAGNERFPVTGVSWWEADAYCRWASGRLPTEAEWEKAAKGGCETHGDQGQCDGSDTSTYPWGEGISGAQANYLSSGDPYEFPNDVTTPVGYYDGSNHGGYQTINSPSPYGLYDVAGNVSEWCSTKFAAYPYDPNDGRETPPESYSESYRVMRGGGPESDEGGLGCARRSHCRPDIWVTSIGWGFRCARTSPAAVGWGVGPLFHLDTLVPPMGSCCGPDGTCTVTPQAACTGASTWALAGVCDPDPCPKPGSCCALDGTCTVTLQIACTAPSAWQGAGTNCTPNPCVATGACCAPTGTCTVTTEMACADPSVWQGAGTVCVSSLCAPTPILLESWTASSLAEGLQIRWEVPLGTTGALYRTWRDPTAGPHDAAPTPDAVLVSSAWISASPEGIIEITDSAAPRGAMIRYFLERRTSGSRSEFLGPLEARWDPPTLAWSAGPTPFRDTVRLTPPRPGPARAEIFDPAGRLVRTLVRADGNAPLEWNGRDDAGRDAPTGVYIVRVGSSADRAVTRLVKIR